MRGHGGGSTAEDCWQRYHGMVSGDWVDWGLCVLSSPLFYNVSSYCRVWRKRLKQIDAGGINYAVNLSHTEVIESQAVAALGGCYSKPGLTLKRLRTDSPDPLFPRCACLRQRVCVLILIRH